jgi:hypothetical protein
MGISSYFTLSDDQLGMLEKKARSSAACGQLAFDGTEVLSLIETIRLFRDSVAAEREACAVTVEGLSIGASACLEAAAAIRARWKA